MVNVIIALLNIILWYIELCDNKILLYLAYTPVPAMFTPTLSIKLTTPQQPSQFYYDRSCSTQPIQK